MYIHIYVYILPTLDTSTFPTLRARALTVSNLQDAHTYVLVAQITQILQILQILHPTLQHYKSKSTNPTTPINLQPYTHNPK